MSRSKAQKPLHVVWFKRDLRIEDHRALAEAADATAETGGTLLPLYMAEPGWWAEPDQSARQWEFVRESLEELRRDLAARGAPLVVRIGDVVRVLSDLHTRFHMTHLWSHEETGGAWTFERDKAVKRWAREAGIPWTEHVQNGVVRRLKDRNGWARRWDQLMAEPIVPAPTSLRPVSDIDPGLIPTAEQLRLAPDGCTERQGGGRGRALLTLESFLEDRGETYRRDMSSPLTAETACSRLSPHFAWGTISMREVAQRCWARMRVLKGIPREEVGLWPGALSSFSGRLHWHCHFMQKFEDEPAIEQLDLHPAYAGLRDLNDDRHQAWCEGRTGLPFVDACMRSLQATGWINFRMRAMLIAVSSYHLWNHWREPGLHLARLFTDYEPGIHWPQTQMQSGTTGINTVRIYNPVKQGHDQDQDGTFVRRWVPELAGLPTPLIHEPWKATPLDLADAGLRIGQDYPVPIVDHLAAARDARQKIWGIRRGDAYCEAAAAIQDKHGSRKSGMPNTGSKRKRRTARTEASDRAQAALDL